MDDNNQKPLDEECTEKTSKYLSDETMKECQKNDEPSAETSTSTKTNIVKTLISIFETKISTTEALLESKDKKSIASLGEASTSPTATPSSKVIRKEYVKNFLGIWKNEKKTALHEHEGLLDDDYDKQDEGTFSYHHDRESPLCKVVSSQSHLEDYIDQPIMLKNRPQDDNSSSSSRSPLLQSFDDIRTIDQLPILATKSRSKDTTATIHPAYCRKRNVEKLSMFAEVKSPVTQEEDQSETKSSLHTKRNVIPETHPLTKVKDLIRRFTKLSSYSSPKQDSTFYESLSQSPDLQRSQQQAKDEKEISYDAHEVAGMSSEVSPGKDTESPPLVGIFPKKGRSPLLPTTPEELYEAAEAGKIPRSFSGYEDVYESYREENPKNVADEST